MEEYLIITDTMVCTGCCATLDHIVTYLFKKVTNKGESKGSANFDRNVELCCLQLERKCADLKLLLKMTLLWLWSRWQFLLLIFWTFVCCQMRPEILQQMLQTVLNIIMFEDCRFLSIHLRHPLSNMAPNWGLSLTFSFISWCNVRNQWSMSRPLLGLILLNEDYFQVHVISVINQNCNNFLKLPSMWLIIKMSPELAGSSDRLSTGRQEGCYDDLVWTDFFLMILPRNISWCISLKHFVWYILNIFQVWEFNGGDWEDIVDKEQGQVHSEPLRLPQGHQWQSQGPQCDNSNFSERYDDLVIVMMIRTEKLVVIIITIQTSDTRWCSVSER